MFQVIVHHFDGVFEHARGKTLRELENEAKQLGGDVRSIINPIPGMSASFAKLTSLMSFIDALVEEANSEEQRRYKWKNVAVKAPRVCSVTDSLTTALETGYRCLTLNLVVSGSDGLVVELTIHLKAMKECAPTAERVRSCPWRSLIHPRPSFDSNPSPTKSDSEHDFARWLR